MCVILCTCVWLRICVIACVCMCVCMCDCMCMCVCVQLYAYKCMSPNDIMLLVPDYIQPLSWLITAVGSRSCGQLGRNSRQLMLVCLPVPQLPSHSNFTPSSIAQRNRVLGASTASQNSCCLQGYNVQICRYSVLLINPCSLVLRWEQGEKSYGWTPRLTHT